MDFLFQVIQERIQIGIVVAVVGRFALPVLDKSRGVIDQSVQRLLFSRGMRYGLVEDAVLVQLPLNPGGRFGAHAPVTRCPEVLANPMRLIAARQAQQFKNGLFTRFHDLVDQSFPEESERFSLGSAVSEAAAQIIHFPSKAEA